jgi:hypothetical protein
MDVPDPVTEGWIEEAIANSRMSVDAGGRGPPAG